MYNSDPSLFLPQGFLGERASGETLAERRGMSLTTYEASLARQGNVEYLTRELEYDRSIGRELAHDRDATLGDTLLHICLEIFQRPDRSDVIRLLVHYGADVNSVNQDGMAPLHMCVLPGETSLLIDFGARIDARDEIGWTPLHFAAHNSEVAHCRILLQRGADFTLLDNEGFDAGDHVSRNLELSQLFAAVKHAGSWQNAHRIALVQLRMLCERGRARPPSTRRDPILARLFAAEPPPSSTKKAARLASRPQRRALPNETFWHILAFWRTDRDD